MNWVGGDPTSNLHFILDILCHLELNVAQIWNSNMYLTPEAMSLLDGVIDIYLTDFKYGNDRCGKRLSGVNGYWSAVGRNHAEANRQGEMIVRHLVMPGHIECCSFPIMRFLAENLDTSRVHVNVMGQYRPEFKAGDHPDIDLRPTAGEIMAVSGLATELGLSLCD